MSITFGSNIASLGAQRRLSQVSESLSSTFERLSSGQRINRASDDAAGLAISSTLNTDSRVFTQSIRNVNDGLSALGIADGALQQLTSITQRQQELAEQAANGTLGSSQRASLNLEAQKLRDEFNRIVSITSFNGVKLLDGTNGELRIQAGSTSQTGALYIGTAGIGVSIKGDGTFASDAPYTAGSGSAPQSVISADFNQDGIADIAASKFGGGVSILLGRGDGTFNSPTSLATSTSQVYEITAGDINGDGVSDLAVGIAGGGSPVLNIIIGNGDGSFRAATSFPGQGFQAVHLADLNGDGKLDLISDLSLANGVTVLIGNGNGTFKAAVSYQALSSTSATLSGDFNGDGKLDLVSTGFNSGSITTILGNGDGTFRSPTTYVVGNNLGTTIHALGIADFNGDGRLDVVNADISAGTASVLLGNGDGSFRAKLSLQTGTISGTAPTSVQVGDFNGDGASDFLTANSGDSTLTIFLGNGDGTFKTRSTLQTVTAPIGITLGDFNGDGATDIAAAETGDAVGVFIGNGTASTYQGAIDLSTRAGAYAAIRSLSTVSTALAQGVGKLGSQESRLRVAANNLLTLRENYAAAASRITDVDVAAESAELTRTQILQQVGASVLAQANQQPSLALQLLR